jgi:anti-sigma factor ChrR (cupin superfamily)
MSEEKAGGGKPLSDEETGILAEAIQPYWPSEERAAHMKAQILRRIRAPGDAEGREPVRLHDAGMTLRTLRVSERQWKSVAKGVEICELREDDFSRTMLIRMQPDSFLLPHYHEMSEESLMLEGDAVIGDETYLEAGDYHFSPAGAVHPLLESPKGCIVFVRGEKKFHPRPTLGLIKRLLRGKGAGPTK